MAAFSDDEQPIWVVMRLSLTGQERTYNVFTLNGAGGSALSTFIT